MMCHVQGRTVPRSKGLLLSLVLVPCAMLFVSCGGDNTPRGTDDVLTIPVEVAAPQLRTTAPEIVLTGIIGAKEEIPLAFKIGGVVERVVVEAGEQVRAGALLATLSLTEIDAQVAAAREGRDKARRDFDRASALYRDSVATASQVDDARTGLEVAEAAVRAAEFNRQYAEIRAPADGIVLRRQLEAGQVVGPGMPVLALRTAAKGVVLRASAADRDAVRIHEGMPATIALDAFAGETFGGRVARVGVAALPMTGTYEIEIAVDATPRTLTSGLIGRARLVPMLDRPVVVVPAASLLEVDGDRASLYALDSLGTGVRRTSIRVRWIDGGMVAIEGGLDTTARVVTAGATRVSEGVRVRVVGRAP